MKQPIKDEQIKAMLDALHGECYDHGFEGKGDPCSWLSPVKVVAAFHRVFELGVENGKRIAANEIVLACDRVLE